MSEQIACGGRPTRPRARPCRACWTPAPWRWARCGATTCWRWTGRSFLRPGDCPRPAAAEPADHRRCRERLRLQPSAAGRIFRRGDVEDERRPGTPNFWSMAGTCSRLADGTWEPSEASPYLLQHYGAHLEQAGVPAPRSSRCWRWVAAGLSVLGTRPASWTTPAAWRAGPGRWPGGLGPAGAGGAELRQHRRHRQQYSPDLLEACARAGVISPVAALVLARQKASLRDRVRCLAALAPLLPAHSRRGCWRRPCSRPSSSAGGTAPSAGLTGALPSRRRGPWPSRLWTPRVTGRACPASHSAGGDCGGLPAGEAGPVLAEALALARAELEAEPGDATAGGGESRARSERPPWPRGVDGGARRVEDDYRAISGPGGRVFARSRASSGDVRSLRRHQRRADGRGLDHPDGVVRPAADGVREQAQASLIAEFQHSAGQPRRRTKSDASAINRIQSPGPAR